jgi:hypothetical protein
MTHTTAVGLWFRFCKSSPISKMQTKNVISLPETFGCLASRHIPLFHAFLQMHLILTRPKPFVITLFTLLSEYGTAHIY